MLLSSSFLLSVTGYAQDADTLLTFLSARSEKLAICLEVGDSVSLFHQAEKRIPQSSAMNLIVAIAYARAVATGNIDPNEKLSFSQIEPLDINGRDFLLWKTYLKHVKKQPDSVSIEQVVSGLVNFNVEANFLFLYDYLGKEALNQELKLLKLRGHDPIYPYPAAKIAIAIQDTSKTNEQHIGSLKSKGVQAYQQSAELSLSSLQKDPNGAFASFMRTDAFTWQKAKFWYDQLPHASSISYYELLKKVASKTFFAPAMQETLERVVEGLVMSSPESQLFFDHCSIISGSTASSLSLLAYAKLKGGEWFYLILNLHQLTAKEFAFVGQHYNEFKLKLLISDEFRQAFVKQIKDLQQEPK